jgi:hypothetical protein
VVGQRGHHMFELLKILILGGSLLIAENSSSITQKPTEIVFEKPIKALNSSASFNVRVSEHVKNAHFPHSVNELMEKFPKGCLKVDVFTENGEKVTFDNPSVSWGSPKNVYINLKTDADLSEVKRFTSLQISSCISISSTDITWYNYGKN